MLLEVENLEVRFRLGGGLFSKAAQLRAVDGVSFSLQRGETFGLVGESGCGKSTLARAVLCLNRPSGGEIRFEGRDLLALSEPELRALRPKIQMVFQDPIAALDGRMTVRALIREPLDIQGRGSKAERDAAVEALMLRVGLSPEMGGRFAHEFSGGQRQRIGIARALALSPDLLVCDEPISALDVSIQAQVVNMLQDLQDERGLTYLFITHDLSMLRHIADRIGVMYLGKLVEVAPAEQLYRAPRHPYTQLLLSAIPVPDPKVRGRQAVADAAAADEVPSPLALPSGCRFRTRCAHASALCAAQEPQPRNFGSGHTVACHHAEEIPQNDGSAALSTRSV